MNYRLALSVHGVGLLNNYLGTSLLLEQEAAVTRYGFCNHCCDFSASSRFKGVGASRGTTMITSKVNIENVATICPSHHPIISITHKHTFARVCQPQS
jgi:hypothetical protein